MNYFKLRISISIVMLSMLVGCYHSPTKGALDSETGKSQVQLRDIQSRAFDTTDRNKTLRTVIITLQDLGFVLDKADETLGIVTATKFTRQTPLKMTVSIRPRGDSRLLVRANAQYGMRPILEAKMYQDFFNSFSKAIFLEAHQIS